MLDDLRKKLNAADVIVPPVPRPNFWTDPAHFNLQPDPMIWTGAEDRSVHFKTITLGQGSNMALPIWALYMQKVYADPTLHISQGDFQKPLSNVDLDFDCDKYEEEQNAAAAPTLNEEEEDEF